MKAWILMLALAGVACSGPLPLHISAVERPGMPPFEPGQQVYHLAGEGWSDLRVGDKVRVYRPRDTRALGQLQVVELREGYVVARLVQRGDTYPQRGDGVSRLEVHPMPTLPKGMTAPELTTERWRALAPGTLVRPTTGAFAPRRELIYFHKQDATLSPAGRAKLAAWVEAWGREGAWNLMLPKEEVESDLGKARVAAVRQALVDLGVAEVGVRAGTVGTAGRFDAMAVVMERW